ncbi:hypothetical protein FBU30_005494 [Linnemannia zychae]|nr:hypothetical protein FBU30_005494 [Linnemannia zychae]
MSPQNVEYLQGWMERMHKLLTRKTNEQDDGRRYTSQAFTHSRIVDAEDDLAIFEYTVLKSDANVLDNWHGGALAGLIDNLTTVALFTHQRKNFAYGGVSSDLHVSYISTVPVGTVVLIECKMLKVGAGLANITATVTEKATGRVIATALHTRFNKDSTMGPAVAKI